MNKVKVFLIISGILFSVILIGLYAVYEVYLSPPLAKSGENITFVVAKNEKDGEVINNLLKQGFIRSAEAFKLVVQVKNYKDIKPGGYYLNKNKNVFSIADKMFSSPPDMKWVVIPEGFRKEQIGEMLAETFDWDDKKITDWNENATAQKEEYTEGVYFPDTYLIPATETPMEIANRLITHFNEQFAPYAEQFYKQNILWTTGLKIASIIQRETNNPEDMPIISGIIWNRLNSGMALQMDATNQYAKGKTDGKWWSVVSAADNRIDSPYNTYLYKGLPPTPICNPGKEAISAAANPATTDCLFYLHDHEGQMHCAKTYKDHLENIKTYL